MTKPFKELVYAVLCDELHFMPRTKAIKVARLRRAVRKSETWEELKSLVKPDEFQELLRRRYEISAEKNRENPVRLSDGAYSVDETLKIEKGFPGRDFYELPDRCMKDWLPEDIVERYGVTESLIHGKGPSMHFPAICDDEIVRLLEKRGYVCERNTELMARVFDVAYDEGYVIRVVENEQGQKELRKYNDDGIEVIDLDQPDSVMDIKEGEDVSLAVFRKLREINAEKKELRKTREEIKSKRNPDKKT